MEGESVANAIFYVLFCTIKAQLTYSPDTPLSNIYISKNLYVITYNPGLATICLSNKLVIQITGISHGLRPGHILHEA